MAKPLLDVTRIDTPPCDAYCTSVVLLRCLLAVTAIAVIVVACGKGKSTSQNPSAALAVTPASGAVPLTVQFDASGSTDANGDTGSRSYTVAITSATLAITPATLPGAANGVAYTQGQASAEGQSIVF